MTRDAVAAAYRDRTHLQLRYIRRGRPETATAIVDAPPTGRDRARVIATRPDGSSFSRWVDPADLYPIHQEGP